MNSAHIPADIDRSVRDRAGNRCEYCQLPQSSQEATFHLDHIIPRHVGGQTSIDNLALACVTCSLKKSSRTHVVDESSGNAVPLFHPRIDSWYAHFAWTADWHVHGRTAVGRATAVALGMNRSAIVSIRALLAELGRFPEGE